MASTAVSAGLTPDSFLHLPLRAARASPQGEDSFLSTPWAHQSHPGQTMINTTYSIFAAVNPYGRILQVWGTPTSLFPEVIATDYPDPDNCTTNLVCATNSYSEAFRSWEANASACRTTCSALGVSFITLNSNLED